MNMIIKLVVIMLITAFPSVLTACNGKADKTYTNFVSVDSTLSFTFIGMDSLYVDTYKSGCGIEQYRLAYIAGNCESVDEIAMSPTFCNDFVGILTIFDFHGKIERIEKHYIRISKNVVGNHYEYFIRFDNEDPTPIYLKRIEKNDNLTDICHNLLF